MTVVTRNENTFKDFANINAKNLVFRVPYSGLSSNELVAAENFHCAGLALRAAKRILGDLSACPPRKYIYKEWSWLLTLLTKIKLKIKHSRDIRSINKDEVATTKQSMEWR